MNIDMNAVKRNVEQQQCPNCKARPKLSITGVDKANVSTCACPGFRQKIEQFTKEQIASQYSNAVKNIFRRI